MTWNHLIKIILWLGGITIYVLSGTYYFSNKNEYDKDILFMTLAIIFHFISIIIIIFIIISIFALVNCWKDGDFDDVLDKPIFKKKTKDDLLTTLKEHLREAEERNDIEEIQRLKQSIEIHRIR